jgi:hypothetical protein
VVGVGAKTLADSVPSATGLRVGDSGCGPGKSMRCSRAAAGSVPASAGRCWPRCSGGGPTSSASALALATPGGVGFASGRFASGVADSAPMLEPAALPAGGRGRPRCESRGGGGPIGPASAVAPTTPGGVGFASGRFASGVADSVPCLSRLHFLLAGLVVSTDSSLSSARGLSSASVRLATCSPRDRRTYRGLCRAQSGRRCCWLRRCWLRMLWMSSAVDGTSSRAKTPSAWLEASYHQ